MILLIFPHEVFFATSRGKFFFLAREVIFAVFCLFKEKGKIIIEISLQTERVLVSADPLRAKTKHPYGGYISHAKSAENTESFFSLTPTALA